MTSAGETARKAKTMTAMTAPFNTPVTATTAEMSLRLAMGGAAFPAVPAVLVGVKDLSGKKMEAEVYGEPIEIETSATTPAELEEGETLIADLTEENVIFTLADDTVAEIIMITEDADETVWATYRTTDGVRDFVDSDRWAQVFGADVEADICEAWDRQTVKGLRHPVSA